MLENYEHYISKNIKLYYRKRLFSPIVFLILLAVLRLAFPIGQMLSPHVLRSSETLKSAYEAGESYCSFTMENLYFTGYIRERGSGTEGYYYYTITDEGCIIILLSPELCEEGLPEIESLTFKGQILKGGDNLSTVYTNLANDLDWTVDGITTELSDYYVNEVNYSGFSTVLLFLLYFGSLIYTVISLVRYSLYIRFPHLAPAVHNLVVYGNPKKIMEEAEEELATLPQLATEDMFITEHYFIMASPYGNALVPIQEILWIYKYSTLHKFLWYHFSISYTLHISAKKHVYIHCPKNAKSDIDGIIDYLSEANHDILVGFNEANRLKVTAIQGKPLHIEKLIAIFRKS